MIPVYEQVTGNKGTMKEITKHFMKMWKKKKKKKNSVGKGL